MADIKTSKLSKLLSTAVNAEMLQEQRLFVGNSEGNLASPAAYDNPDFHRGTADSDSDDEAVFSMSDAESSRKSSKEERGDAGAEDSRDDEEREITQL